MTEAIMQTVIEAVKVVIWAIVVDKALECAGSRSEPVNTDPKLGSST